ncbi:MAG: TonB family protein [Candidatus Methylomirabilales bacterium]
MEARPIPREEPAPALQPVPPRVEAKLPVVPEKAPAPPAPLPEGGLSLGGPAQGRPDLSARREAERPGLPALRRSLRDQIASLGTGMTAETGEQTVNLDSQEPRFLSYLARVKRRIQRTWTYPPDALALGLGGELVLVFTLNPAGTLTDLALIRSSGFPVLDEEALRAVKAAAPFDPFPAELGREPWNISAAFHYTLPRASRPR